MGSRATDATLRGLGHSIMSPWKNENASTIELDIPDASGICKAPRYGPVLCVVFLPGMNIVAFQPIAPTATYAVEPLDTSGMALLH